MAFFIWYFSICHKDKWNFKYLVKFIQWSQQITIVFSTIYRRSVLSIVKKSQITNRNRIKLLLHLFTCLEWNIVLCMYPIMEKLTQQKSNFILKMCKFSFRVRDFLKYQEFRRKIDAISRWESGCMMRIDLKWAENSQKIE